MNRLGLSDEELALLTVVAGAAHPIGARQAAAALREVGTTVSESTVSRLLRRLDGRGYSISLDGKGRVVTDSGRTTLRELGEKESRGIGIAAAIEVRTVRELLDLLHTRRAVEREAAREAALRARPEELEQLHGLIEEHKAVVASGDVPRRVALEFHRRIGKLSRNRVLVAMTEYVLAGRLDALEAALDVVIGSHRSELVSVDEHLGLFRAIAEHDAEAAERAMDQHLWRLIHEVEAYETEERAPLVERILAFVTRQTVTEARH